MKRRQGIQRRILQSVFAVLSAVLSIAFAFPSAIAVEPDEVLEDPALEARAREVGSVLRCVVCQSQSIDDSNAPLAKDLRLLVRERIVAGDTNEEVVDYVVARYGDYVLLKPRVGPSTYLLWGMPLFLFLTSLSVLLLTLRGAKSRAVTTLEPLNPEDIETGAIAERDDNEDRQTP